MKNESNRTKAIEVLYTSEEFAKMTSSEICQIIKKDKHTAIVGGEDHKCGGRHIVRFSNWKELMKYSS